MRTVAELGHVGMEGADLALVQGSAPYGHRRAVLHLPSLGQHASGPAADQRPGDEDFVDRLEHVLGQRQVSPAGKNHDQVGSLAAQGVGHLARRLAGRDPGVPITRDGAGDANPHTLTILPACRGA